MTSLRVLVVGTGCPITEQLEEVGHYVTPLEGCGDAIEALQLQRFDVVVLGPEVQAWDLTKVAQEIQELNRRSPVRTAVLGITSEGLPRQSAPELDGYLPGQGTPEALVATLLNLAARSTTAECSKTNQPQLPVLSVAELHEHLDFDNDLLLELISLYSSERKRQSLEMREALAAGDLVQLSRLAHTIKGSLGSLHAPSARAEAQLLEKAALEKNRSACERLLPGFELKLDELEAELQALSQSLTQNQ